MTSYPIHQFDSFTNTIFGGNPTVTVLQAENLTDQQMRKIAREMNLSETGFILPSTKADFRLRFFTPSGSEIRFCGHATVGALATIAKEKLFGCIPPGKKFLVETNAGIMEMEIDLANPLKPIYVLGLPQVDMRPVNFGLKELANGLGIPADLIDPSLPILFDKNSNYLYFAVPSLEKLGRLEPDTKLATDFCKKNDGIVVICAMTAETFDKNNKIHSRGFAPLVGIPEDPFTGSMQVGVAAYALRFGMVDSDTKWIGAEQGHFMDRPGFVNIKIESYDPVQVKLYADAAHVFSSNIIL